MKTKVHCYSACLAIFIACSGAAPALQEPGQLASQKAWVLKSWTADPEILTRTSKRPGISFKDGKFSMSGGVNGMTGKYSAKRDGRLILKGGGMTEMAGDPAAMKTEEVFMQLFSGVTHWRVQGKALVLSNGTPELELRFQAREPVKAKPLTGTEWSLEGFEKRGKEAASDTALVAGTTITLSIGPDGRATGSAGVNRYFGKAEVAQGDRITFGPMASTRRGGPPEAMAQERTYLKQLSEVSNWAVVGDRLVLTGKDGSFALRYGAK